MTFRSEWAFVKDLFKRASAACRAPILTSRACQTIGYGSSRAAVYGLRRERFLETPWVAVEEMTTGRNLEGQRLGPYHIVSRIVRLFEEALIHARTAVEQDPQSFVGRWELGIACHWNGQYQEAIAVLEPLWAESGNNWVAMQIVPIYAKAGRHDQARAIYDARLAGRAREHVPPFVLAVCASARGDHEAAIRFSGAAVEARDLLFALFHSWLPDLEPLRADPRFAALIDQFNARMRSQP